MAVCGYALSDTFGPISITFIQPFLDDTSRTLRQYSGQKKSTWKGAQLSQRGLRNAGIAQRVLKLRSKKVWKVFWTPPPHPHYRKNNFWNVFPKKRRPTHPPAPSHPLHFTVNFLLTRKYLEGAPERKGTQFFKFTIQPPPNQISLGTSWQ
jgi:hypothetical protein